MIKNILVPTDFSEQSEFALKAAAQLCKKTGAKIHLLHMLELPTQTIDITAAGRHQVPEAILFMEKVHEQFDELRDKEYTQGVEIEEVIHFEKAFEGIIKISKGREADLIIMGSHGSEGIKEILVGSNTEKVVNTSDIPVLVLKKEIDLDSIKHILFATDLKKQSKPVLKIISQYAKALNAYLHLIRINTVSNFISTAEFHEKAGAILQDVEVENLVLKHHCDIDIEKGIISYAESGGINLICLGTHRRKGILDVISRRIGKSVANHADLPVMTIRLY